MKIFIVILLAVILSGCSTQGKSITCWTDACLEQEKRSSEARAAKTICIEKPDGYTECFYPGTRWKPPRIYTYKTAPDK